MKIINKLNCTDLAEDIEVHNTLNLKLFTKDQKLKPEVLEALNNIAKDLLDFIAEKDVKIEVKDIVLVGSSASYNYTKDSDIDLHIIADTSKFKDTDKLYEKLYDAFKSLFNDKYPNLNIYNIPVEVYIETNNTINSNGIYSIKFNKWVTEPKFENIPEFDEDNFNNVFSNWESRYKELISDIKNNSNITLTEATTTLTKEEKLKLFNDGKRRENLRAMGDTKLVDYYYACGPRWLNLPKASAELEAEIKKRGLTVTWNKWPIKLDKGLKDNFIWAKSQLDRYTLTATFLPGTPQKARDTALSNFIIETLDNTQYSAKNNKMLLAYMFVFILVLKGRDAVANQLIYSYNIDKKLLKQAFTTWGEYTYLISFATDLITENEFLNEDLKLNLDTLNEGDYGSIKYKFINKINQKMPNTIKRSDSKERIINNKPYKLWNATLHHVDGDHDNSDDSNLVLICPPDDNPDKATTVHKLIHKLAEFEAGKTNDIINTIIKDIDNLGCSFKYIKDDTVQDINSFSQWWESSDNKKDALINQSIAAIKNQINKWITNPNKASTATDIETSQELIEKFSKNVTKIDKFIDDLYKLRKDNIANKGEYSIENLIFKEFRNKGYLDNLKQLKNKLKEAELSLHE